MSAPPLTVSLAAPADFPTLAAILPLANAANPIDRFMFRHDNPTDHSTPPPVSAPPPPSHRWALAQFRAGLHSAKKPRGPTTYLLKAAPAESEAVGFAIIRIVGSGEKDAVGNKEGITGEAAAADAVQADVEPEARGGDEAGGDEAHEADANEMINPEFSAVYNTKLKEIYARCMAGKEHGYWSTLMVLPHWQNRGVGSAMIRWALQNLDLDRMPVFINAQPDGHRLYQKFGWRDVENVDIDLSLWAGPNKGYGLHRTVCMVREPSAGIH